MCSILLGFMLVFGQPGERAERADANVGAPAVPDAVRFETDVMAVLSKAGCNAGTCHGNQNGKGGFKLSLRGEDPLADFAALTRDAGGRRIDRERPDASLVLLKPTARLPHEGGRRFEAGSPEHQILQKWIVAGAPPQPPGAPRLVELTAAPDHAVIEGTGGKLPLTVTATFSDGTSRDVTPLAVFETTGPEVEVDRGGGVAWTRPGEAVVLVRYLDRRAVVRLAFVPPRPDFAWLEEDESNPVDRLVNARLRRLKIVPAETASDATFLRRVSLDLLGILPTAAEARAYLSDPSPDRRTRLVDSLLNRPEFADRWALRWSDLLRNEEKVLDGKGVQALHHWLREVFALDRPLDRWVAELMTASGSTYSAPAANFYRANRESTARSETAAQVFLGIRLQCARCHNHPFDRWTQEDYYSWAGVFSGIDYKVVENRRRDQNDGHEFDGEQIVRVGLAQPLTHPRTHEPVPPRLLGEDVPSGLDPDRLARAAAWATSAENPWFARVQANRVWFQLMGRGLVEPVDDFRATNPPADPELLDFLAAELVREGFRLKPLVRLIATSRAYQRSAVPQPSDDSDESTFSRAIVRPLEAEPLLDAVSQVTGHAPRFRGFPRGIRAGQLPGVQANRSRYDRLADGDRFLALFGKPPRLLACECERSADPTLGQAFEMTSGELLHGLLVAPGSRLDEWADSNAHSGEILEDVFLSALSRFPTADELDPFSRLLDEATDRRRTLEDLVWGLVNSNEFLLRH
jgi:hypothetical protein